MAEYIEREAAVNICSNQYKECLRKNDWCGDTVAWNICYGIKAIPAADVAPVVHGQMRVKITTDDFRDIERARADGCYRKHYFCPNCGIEIGHKTFDRKRQFGQGTVLHSNAFPNYCHNCGARMDGE